MASSQETFIKKSTTKTKENSRSRDIQKNTGLRKCFTALVDRKQVSLDIDVLRLMIKYELLINLDSLSEDLAEVLPVMLVMYIKTWPGWQKSKDYFSGNLIFRDWYEKFRQYIVVRLNYLIKNGYDLAIDMIKEEKKKLDTTPNSLQDLGSQTISTTIQSLKNVQDRGAQTDYTAPRSLAPFTIQIEGSPNLLGSITFSSPGDNIKILKYPNGTISQISISELLNWPYVSLEFISPELHFKRNNCNGYVRYLSIVNSRFTLDKSDFIEEIVVIDPTTGRNCYTVQLLRCYIKEYMKLLKSVKAIDKNTVDICQLLCDEFLKDIEDIDMNNTMATNTSVLFNIGKQIYIRNKKPKSLFNCTGNNKEVVYTEQLIPKIETSLHYFKGIQDVTTPDVSFSYLNILNAALKINNTVEQLGPAMPVINYHCNFCNVTFQKDTSLISHLIDTHEYEPNVLCLKCQKSLNINLLARSRWSHSCQ